MIKSSRRIDIFVPIIMIDERSLQLPGKSIELSAVRRPTFHAVLFLAYIRFYTRGGVHYVWGFRHPTYDAFRGLRRVRSASLDKRRQRIAAGKAELRVILERIMEECRRIESFLEQDIFIPHSSWKAFSREGRARVGEIPNDLLYREEAGYVLGFWDNHEHLGRRNDAFVKSELIKFKDFFDAQRLTIEQRIAAITFEDRVLLVAAAGSGKTSTIVAKIGYAIKKGIALPHEILTLAFNRKAAAEIAQRATEKLSEEFDVSSLNSFTFHGLGNRIIRKAAQEGYSIASCDLDQLSDSDVKVENIEFKRSVPKIYAELLRSDPEFQKRVLNYLALYSPMTVDTSAFTTREEYEKFVRRENSQADRKDRKSFVTLDGHEALSPQARTICDWLFVNGVEYRYRQAAPWVNRYQKKAPYCPDFHYPEADLWHEHFHTNADGKPDPYLGESYSKVIEERRKTLMTNGAKYFITTNAAFEDGTFDEHMRTILRSHGMEIRPIPAEEIEKAIGSHRADSFTDLIAEFIGLWKGADIPLEELEGRARGHQRHTDFLWLAHRIRSRYDTMLKERNAIDFSDMINKANEFLGKGAWRSEYKLILVDEFQDISRTRAALVKNLLDQVDGSLLFGVGDDWQAINGFAGSELAIMRNFEAFFGTTAQLFLTETFRSNQGIANIASTFVMKNPSQIKKGVNARDKTLEDVIRYIEYDGYEEQLDKHYPPLLREIAELQPKSIKILCMTNRRVESVSTLIKPFLKEIAERAPSIEVEVLTKHRSKGLEADFVILDLMQLGKFPIRKPKDSVLRLVSPEAEDYQDAEARRLMYVALTRARKRVYVMVSKSKPSPFVDEIRGSKKVSGPARAKACPSCLIGVLVERQSKDKKFFGCSRYVHGGAGCSYTQ